MACSKLEAMAIYVVKQACGNEIMPSVYLLKRMMVVYNIIILIYHDIKELAPVIV